MPPINPENIDTYIAGFPPATRALLQQVRMTIQAAAPEAAESIRYQIPTFRLNGNLVHFAAYKKHIGLYPDVKEIEALEPYRKARASLHFPLDQPLPLELIVQLVRHRMESNNSKSSSKQNS